MGVSFSKCHFELLFSVKARPNSRNISTQSVTRVWPPCSNMLDGVGLSLKLVNFLLQHFWMLQDVDHVWPAPSQHLTARSIQDVALKCCVRLAGP